MLRDLRINMSSYKKRRDASMEQALPISGNYKHICVNTLQNFKRVFLENTFLKMAAILLTAVINVST